MTFSHQKHKGPITAILITGLAAILIALKSDAAARKAYVPAPKPSPTPSITAPPNPLPSPLPSGTPIFSIKTATGYSKAERERLNVAIDYANIILPSKCARDFMTKRALIQTNGKTRDQVMDDLLKAPYAFQLELYYANNRVVGFTNPAPYQIIHQNRKFYAGSHPVDIASNLIHEYSHKVGYDHSYNPNASRPYSVPYSLNAMTEECGVQMGLYKQGLKELTLIKKMK